MLARASLKWHHRLLFFRYGQRTSTCCQQTGSQVRSQRALWVNRWSTSRITAWRGRGWSSTRSQPSPRCITSNMTTTSTSTSTTWWRPPSTDCASSPGPAANPPPTRPSVRSFSEKPCGEIQKPFSLICKLPHGQKRLFLGQCSFEPNVSVLGCETDLGSVVSPSRWSGARRLLGSVTRSYCSTSRVRIHFFFSANRWNETALLTL